ncbi:MAG: penicillin-binding protein activator [Alphaproteobacteria bacterium]|nr:penicillin-binding protein activator [Alphaproteobacteria bacterium]
MTDILKNAHSFLRAVFSLRLICVFCLAAVALGGCSTTWFGSSQKQAKRPTATRTAIPAKPKTPPLTDFSAKTGALTTPSLKDQTVTAAPVSDGKTHVAILLPLSGKNASLGQAMLNAAQLAVFDMAGDNFELMPRDTGANPESAALASRDAIGSGAQLLIGPLFAADVSAVKPVVQESATSMLALSSDISVAEPGAYIMGFAPAPMVERTLDFAAKRGMTRFAGIFSSDAYGKLMKQSFKDVITRQGNSMVIAETYAGTGDITRATKGVLAKLDQIDALFIPASGVELKQIAAQLTEAGFDKNKVKLLGSGLWDDLSSAKPEILIGGWYAAAEPEARESFIKNYTATYGATPPRLATLAYDATALAVVLSRRGGNFNSAALLNPSGFAGLDGIFRLTPQGTIERGMAINELTPTGNKAIDPAPSTFAGM